METLLGHWIPHTLVHKAVQEAPLVVGYDQLVPFLRLEAETFQGVVLNEGEPNIISPI